MEQEEITKIYETLAPMAGDYANAQAEQIGQAQRSMGPMAANVMGQSQTAGLGNYTYNRLMRPQVDVMRDEIRTQGYANQLNRLLSGALNNARNNYNRKSRGGGGGTQDTTNPENQPNDGVTTIGGSGTKSTGSGRTTQWTAVPNSYQWQDESGNWHTAKRLDSMTDVQWMDTYLFAKRKAESEGKGFRDGSGE